MACERPSRKSKENNHPRGFFELHQRDILGYYYIFTQQWSRLLRIPYGH